MTESFLKIENSDFDKPFRRKQIHDAVFSGGYISFDKIMTIPLLLREKLTEKYSIINITEQSRKISTDQTAKFLFLLQDGYCVEAVFLIDRNNRVTFCISSQVGCRMGCTFCQTGLMGLLRNCTANEIFSQVIFLYHYMVHERNINDRLFNIVYMGMGEPLDNIDEVKTSIGLITDKKNFGLSPTRITVSTCGLIESIENLLDEYPTLRIAVSLNNPIQKEREKIMNIAKKYSVDEIAIKLKEIYIKYGNRITLEYVLIDGVSNTIEAIEALQLFNHEAFHINIIPLNDPANSEARPSEEKIRSFINDLESRNICVSRRYRRGDDIQADCGQLFYQHHKENDIS